MSKREMVDELLKKLEFTYSGYLPDGQKHARVNVEEMPCSFEHFKYSARKSGYDAAQLFKGRLAYVWKVKGTEV